MDVSQLDDASRPLSPHAMHAFFKVGGFVPEEPRAHADAGAAVKGAFGT
ncbi:hypothetical protein [Caballeronia sp. M1242]|nr:hypothetical protein [Caballeronia sp. M1242]QSN62493.1 hypothetical protein JYK05_06390 [Caballeronia sp. M1242]